MNKEFYTIMYDENSFLPNNFYKEKTNNITECIKFSYYEDAKRYFNKLRKDKGFKLVKVECKIISYIEELCNIPEIEKLYENKKDSKYQNEDSFVDSKITEELKQAADLEYKKLLKKLLDE